MGEFEKLIADDAFVEHARFGDNRYGTSKKMIAEMGDLGKVVVLDIEMEVSLFFPSLIIPPFFSFPSVYLIPCLFV